MSKEKIVLNLRGGLGNQLFGIYAALAIQEELKVKCEIHTYGIDRSHDIHNSNATEFSYGRDINFINKSTLIERLHERTFIRKVVARFEPSSRTFGRTTYREDLQNNRELIEDLRQLLDYKARKIILTGYFQDFSYYNKMKVFLPDFRLLEKTSWLNYNCELAASVNPIMVHIRLGDYFQNGMQILSKDYFNTALSEMVNLVETDDVWVFSDSPDIAKKYLDLPMSKKVRFLPNDQKASETLMLMREGSGLICSNSTFSFWAGRTSSHARPIIYPKRFSDKEDVSVRNIPQEWISIRN